MGLSIIGAFLVVGGFNAFNSAPSWIDLLAISAGFLFAMNNVIFRATPELPTVLKLNFMFLGKHFGLISTSANGSLNRTGGL
ncbi:hypothetical protein THIOSC15_2570002 [uncultured Thiomicrorhabdus sp.]